MAHPYTPLRREPREIRLLDIEPWTADRNEPIRLRLHPTVLDQAGDYICLSYTWGQPEPTHSIFLNDFDFDVRENLHSALLHLRLPDKPLRIWIDAICINQDDMDEREFQVSIMQHVYKSATKVIAWIGEADPHATREAVHFVKEMARKPISWLSSRNRTDDMVEWIKSITADGFVGSRWLDLLDLISRPWYSRIWIVQEVVMGKEVIVQCGLHQVDWMDLYYCAGFVMIHYQLIASIAAPNPNRYPEQFKFYRNDIPLARLCAAARRICKVGALCWDQETHPASAPERMQKSLITRTSDQTLYDLISCFWTFNATDARDRVYALLGLAEILENIKHPLPTVSYHQDLHLAELLTAVLDSHLEAGSDLSFLSQARGVDEQDEFPSWMPPAHFDNDDRDYVSSRPRQFMPLENEPGVTSYCADRLCRPIYAYIDTHSKTLNVLGWVAGVIDQLSQVYDRGDQDDNDELIKNQFNARVQWASMAGVAESDAKHRLLYWALVDEQKELVKAEMLKLSREEFDRHQQFLGTLLMSGSDSAIEAVSSGSFLGAKVPEQIRSRQRGKLDPILMRISRTCSRRKFFTCSELGLQGERLGSENFGLCTMDARKGDKVAMFLGSNTLHIIREVVTDANGATIYVWVGQAYVHNWMQGQLVHKMVTASGMMAAQRIRLV